MKKLLGKACHQLHAPEKGQDTQECLRALYSPTCSVLCPSLPHAQGQKLVFQRVAPAGTCQTIFQSLAFQHQANSTVLAFLPHGTPCSCLFPCGHSLLPCSRGNHTPIIGCCALSQVSVFSWGRTNFIIQRNTLGAMLQWPASAVTLFEARVREDVI